MVVGAAAAGLATVLALWTTVRRADAPVVALGSVVIDSVVRGDVVQDVTAPGTLVPERMHLITAQTSARVERLLREPGARVQAGELLLTLANPDVQTQALTAEERVRQAEVDLINTRATLTMQALAQEALIAGLTTQRISATQSQRVSDSLFKYQFASQNDARNATALADEMTTRVRVETERLRVMRTTLDEQARARQGQIAQLRAIAENQRTRWQSLQVRAPSAGVLQDLSLQPGQWVPEGALLARVVQPEKLKAVLRIAESDGPAVQIGQAVAVDTRNGVIPARVSRKATSAQSGVILVDATIESALPAGAVPDLNVDGSIRVDVLRNALTISRPAFAAGNATISLFRLDRDGRTAERVPVQLGRATATRVEVRAGLTAGDRVIVSDLAQHASAARIVLR
jgi:HlyD family secretion protein